MTDKQYLEQRKLFGKEVARIESLPQTMRWREIKNLLFKVKPELKQLDDEFILDVKFQREQNILTDTGASKSGSTRALYSMPQFLYSVLHLMDPDFTKMQEDPTTNKIINRKIAEAFPEYRIARKV